MSFSLDSTCSSGAKFWLWYREVVLLLDKQIVNNLVFLRNFVFHKQKPRFKFYILFTEHISSHALFHNVIVKPFALLVHFVRPQLADLNLHEVLGLSANWR
jgi:hypothetical protein